MVTTKVRYNSMHQKAINVKFLCHFKNNSFINYNQFGFRRNNNKSCELALNTMVEQSLNKII